MLDAPLLLTEGGLETWLVYHEGIDLPCFAAFDLVRRPGGREVLERHYRAFAELGVREGVGVVLETATWRACADWGARLGYDAAALEALHHELVDLLLGVRASYAPSPVPILVAGCVGPRSDAYAPTLRMGVAEAADYHRAQLATFAATPVDLVVASTLGTVEEALRATWPGLRVVGGCCGTDRRHVERIVRGWAR